MIRLLIDSLEAGGNERDCVRLANGFAERGLRVELLLVRAKGPFLNNLHPVVRVHDFNTMKARWSFWRISRHLRTGPAPVLVFGFHLAAGLLIARALGWHSAPVIYREGSSPRANVKPGLIWLYRWIITRADKIIAQSHVGAQELQSLKVPHNKIVVIPNPCTPVAVPQIKYRPSPQPVPPLILGVGRLSDQKGFDRLIRTFGRLHAEDASAQLVILGEGPERKRLERMVAELGLQDAVRLPGFVSDVSVWYRRASVFALSSPYEGQPNALIEAILHQVPVVVRSCRGGVAELLKECGLLDHFLTEERFDRQFVGEVKRVLAEPSARCEAARQRLLEFMRPDKVEAAYLSACGIKFPGEAGVPCST